MLTIYCSTHGSEVLVGPRRIRRLINTDRGVMLEVECYCGTRVRAVTGRQARTPSTSLPPDQWCARGHSIVPAAGR